MLRLTPQELNQAKTLTGKIVKNMSYVTIIGGVTCFFEGITALSNLHENPIMNIDEIEAMEQKRKNKKDKKDGHSVY